MKKNQNKLFVTLLALLFSFSLWGEDYLSELPKGLDSLLSAEQTLIDRNVNPDRILPPSIAGQREEFRPEKRNWFDVESIWLPESELNVAEIPGSAFHHPAFVKTENGKRSFRLFIHPESKKLYADLMEKYPSAGSIKATSTSSSRTLLARIDKGEFFFLKLSLDVELGGVVRTIPQGEVARSVGFSKYLARMPSPNPGFQVIPEPLGIIPKGMARGGQLLREIPMKAFEEGKQLVPLFSLYAKDKDGRSLLEGILKGKGDPEVYVKKTILGPFVKAWVDWAAKGKVVMEAHAQNVLIQLDAKGEPTGVFYHRDMGGFNIDMTAKEAKKGNFPTFSGVEKDYHLEFSKKAVHQSLYTYFEGGFLYNVEKELNRLYPDRPSEIFKGFQDLLVDELNSRIPVGKVRVTRETLYAGLIPTLDELKKSTPVVVPECGVMGDFFGALASLFR